MELQKLLQVVYQAIARSIKIQDLKMRLESGIIGRAVFVAACNYLPDSKIMYRWKARVIDVRDVA